VKRPNNDCESQEASSFIDSPGFHPDVHSMRIERGASRREAKTHQCLDALCICKGCRGKVHPQHPTAASISVSPKSKILNNLS
jgi:hypothetical protein